MKNWIVYFLDDTLFEGHNFYFTQIHRNVGNDTYNTYYTYRKNGVEQFKITQAHNRQSLGFYYSVVRVLIRRHAIAQGSDGQALQKKVYVCGNSLFFHIYPRIGLKICYLTQTCLLLL